MSDFAANLEAADGAVQELLGGPVHYTSVDGVEADVVAVFDAMVYRQEATRFASRPGIARVNPAAFVRLRDLPTAPALDDLIGKDGRSYVIREVQTDGLGGAWLHLLEVAQVLP